VLSANLRAATAKPQANLAPTPPMGWASWNHFFCDYNAQTIRDQADALVSTGMRDLGYRYVLIQECIAPGRDAGGELVVDPVRFSHGMKALTNYIHARGLKAGIYTDVGPYTCYSKPRYQGSYRHEAQDARTFASWGMDLVEMDYCNRVPGHTGREVYERMAAAIQNTHRPMLFYICSWEMKIRGRGREGRPNCGAPPGTSAPRKIVLNGRASSRILRSTQDMRHSARQIAGMIPTCWKWGILASTWSKHVLIFPCGPSPLLLCGLGTT
jgi:hypothetical protein